jgi:copper homeostasis protein
MVVEVCCFNIESCIAAAAGGADRIELCGSPNEGGTTPSYGLIKQAMQAVSIPIYPIIRPRGGDFLYSKAEAAEIMYDVAACEQLGCPGVVFGALKEDGTLHQSLLMELVKLCGNMDITLHRAFDRTRDAKEALAMAIDIGFKRILTSGRASNVDDGIDTLKELVAIAANEIIIMPGAGVRANNVAHLIEVTKATEVHTSVRSFKPSIMQYSNAVFGGLTNDGQYVFTETKAVADFVAAIKN